MSASSSSRPVPASRRRFGLALLALSVALPGCHGHHHADGSATPRKYVAPTPHSVGEEMVPSPAEDQPNPVARLDTHPAPLVNFDGEPYFLISDTQTGGRKRLELVRNGDTPELTRRQVLVRLEPAPSLRSYEKAYLAHLPGVERRVHYRTANHLVWSTLRYEPGGAIFTAMDWHAQGHAVVCCEAVVREHLPTAGASATPAPAPQVSGTPHPVASAPADPETLAFQRLVRSRERLWDADLARIYQGSSELLHDPAEARLAVPTSTPSPHSTPAKP